MLRISKSVRLLAPIALIVAGSLLASTITVALPSSRAWNQTTQNVATATTVPLAFNQNTYDIGGIHSTTVNTTRFTLTPGTWQLTGQIEYPPNAAGMRQAHWLLNGTTIIGASGYANAGGTYATRTQVTTMYLCTTAGDYVELVAFQDSGATLAVASGTYATWGTATRIR